MAYNLQPLPVQIGIFPQYIANQTETLVLKEKILSLSGDSFDVRLANGQPLLKVKGKLLTLGSRKSVYDCNDTHLFDIYREILHIHSTYVLEDPKGNKFFELRSNIQLIGTTATAKFATPATGKREALTMKGNFLDTRGDIKDDTGHVVARIDRKLLNARQLLFDQDSYAVVVAPGMDMAVVAAMCICLDNRNNER
ncbi:hypothetical protein SEPCBS57363_003132 [Sporothrix epigloea]|uniref:Tubby C-terminal-like domain-containing protein n=1 Tax=Sporothrix epigloea TaxID=1892477 RepID=A0ABP0DL36_9PEZI